MTTPSKHRTKLAPDHLDQDFHDTIDAYRARVVSLGQECQTAQATASALNTRVALLSAQALAAEASAAIATDNFAAAKATDRSLEASIKLAGATCDHALDVTSKTESTYVTTHELADKLRQGVQLMESLQASIERAVSKNGMPSFVAAAAKVTLASCMNGANASLTALSDAAAAMEGAAQAQQSALALPAALQRLEEAMRGFTRNALSDLSGVPRTLEAALQNQVDGATTPPVSDGSATSFFVQNVGFSTALSSFKSAVIAGAMPAAGSTQGPQPETGMVRAFYQLFQILEQSKKVILDGKTTAEGDLIRAAQALERAQTSVQYATEAMNAAQQAVLT